MTMRFMLLTILLVPASCAALTAEQSSALTVNANPVRKVVTMLQMMMKKIEEEGVKEKELYDKFMCYCATADETLGKSIGDANTKIPQLESDIKEAVETKANLDAIAKAVAALEKGMAGGFLQSSLAGVL